MKIEELTPEQIREMAINNPELLYKNNKLIVYLHNSKWVLENHPDWVCKHVPKAIIDNNPELVFYYNPEWMMEHKLKWVCENRPDVICKNYNSTVCDNINNNKKKQIDIKNTKTKLKNKLDDLDNNYISDRLNDIANLISDITERVRYYGGFNEEALTMSRKLDLIGVTISNIIGVYKSLINKLDNIEQIDDYSLETDTKIKISDLTNEDHIKLAVFYPDWMAIYCPAWMTKYRNKWMLKNHPELISKYQIKQNGYVPDAIAKILTDEDD